MNNIIYGNMVGCGTGPLKTLILEDENGNQLTGVVTGSEVMFTATDNDVREGIVYASNNGVSTGTLQVPSGEASSSLYVLSCGFTLDEDVEPGFDEYSFSCDGLNSSTRHIIVVSHRNSEDDEEIPLVVWHRVDLNARFLYAQTYNSVSKAGICNLGENKITIMFPTYSRDSISKFIITAY